MMEMIIHNAKVYIEKGQFAEAVLIRGDKIAAVGSNAEVLAIAPDAEKFDAKGKLLLPGFNDSHLHLHSFGTNLHRIQAYDVKSIDDLVERAKNQISGMQVPKGAVITGSGWNDEMFAGEKRHPNRHDMDRISTDHAVIIRRVCGHSLCCNSLALEMAGITKDTNQVDGGSIDLDDKGEPLGILRENAMDLIWHIIPHYTAEQTEEQLLYAMRHALENGLTSVSTNDIGNDNSEFIINAYTKLFNESGIHFRLNMQCTLDDESKIEDFVKRGWVTKASLGHPYITMGPLKVFADGSLGSRTAHLRKAYNDEPSIKGLQVHPLDRMDALVQKAHNNGIQVVIHAIGDAAVEQVVNAFDKVIKNNKNDLRHAVVHCQITDLPLLQRMADNDILAIVQPIFLTHDLYMVDDRVGKELAATSYAFNTMEKLGIRTAYGTDCPVESMSPIDCIHCAVNRHDVANGHPQNGFYTDECVNVYTAVDAYTSGTAYATFNEGNKGRIKKDFLADLVLLDSDIFTIPKNEIRNTNVLLTMVGGNIAYRK